MKHDILTFAQSQYGREQIMSPEAGLIKTVSSEYQISIWDLLNTGIRTIGKLSKLDKTAPHPPGYSICLDDGNFRLNQGDAEKEIKDFWYEIDQIVNDNTLHKGLINYSSTEVEMFETIFQKSQPLLGEIKIPSYQVLCNTLKMSLQNEQNRTSTKTLNNAIVAFVTEVIRIRFFIADDSPQAKSHRDKINKAITKLKEYFRGKFEPPIVEKLNKVEEKLGYSIGISIMLDKLIWLTQPLADLMSMLEGVISKEYHAYWDFFAIAADHSRPRLLQGMELYLARLEQQIRTPAPTDPKK